MAKIDLKNQSIPKLFFRYFIPSFFAMLAMSTYSSVDGIFVGQKLGGDALAAIGLSWPVFPVLIAYELLFSIGGASLASYFLGKGDAHRARVVFSSVFYFALFSGVIIGVLLYLFRTEIVLFLGASEKLLPLTLEYISVIFLFAFVIVLQPLLDIFAINDKRPTLAMVSMLVGAGSNIILNYIFLFIFEWGLFGSALATILAHFIALCILLQHFLSKRGDLYFIFTVDFHALFIAAKNGVAQASSEISASVIMLITNHFLGSIVGDRGITIYSVMMYVGVVIFTVLISVSQGVQPIASFNYGAKSRERVIAILRFGSIFSLCSGILLYLLMYTFGEYFALLFLHRNAQGEIDTTLLHDIMEAIDIYFIGFALVGFNMVAASFFQSLQRPLSSFIVMISYALVFDLMFLMILPNFFGVYGIWLSYPLGVILSCFVTIGVIVYEFKRGVLAPKNWAK